MPLGVEFGDECFRGRMWAAWVEDWARGWGWALEFWSWGPWVWIPALPGQATDMVGTLFLSSPVLEPSLSSQVMVFCGFRWVDSLTCKSSSANWVGLKLLTQSPLWWQQLRSLPALSACQMCPPWASCSLARVGAVHQSAKDFGGVYMGVLGLPHGSILQSFPISNCSSSSDPILWLLGLVRLRLSFWVSSHRVVCRLRSVLSGKVR